MLYFLACDFVILFRMMSSFIREHLFFLSINLFIFFLFLSGLSAGNAYCTQKFVTIHLFAIFFCFIVAFSD